MIIPENNHAKIALDTNPCGTRRRVVPRDRWFDQIKQELSVGFEHNGYKQPGTELIGGESLSRLNPKRCNTMKKKV